MRDYIHTHTKVMAQRTPINFALSASPVLIPPSVFKFEMGTHTFYFFPRRLRVYDIRYAYIFIIIIQKNYKKKQHHLHGGAKKQKKKTLLRRWMHKAIATCDATTTIEEKDPFIWVKMKEYANQLAFLFFIAIRSDVCIVHAPDSNREFDAFGASDAFVFLSACFIYEVWRRLFTVGGVTGRVAWRG